MSPGALRPQALADSVSSWEIMDAVDVAVFVVDSACRVVAFNRAAEALTGRGRQQVLGLTCREGLQWAACEPVCSVLEGAAVSDAQLELPTADGGRVLVRRRIVALRDSHGRIVGAVGTLHEQQDEEQERPSRVSRPWDLEDVAPLRAIVGRSKEIHRIVDTIRRLAKSDASVLITGESGTGKELVARAVHGVSRRRDHPFVAVNCAAMPSDLIESELFGHVRGAFTGAVRDRVGAVEAAARGTFFLDEIGELHPSLQAKLLRLLQERSYQRIGDSTARAADIRVVAATHVDLEQAIARERFREDLYYRLRVIPIHIPPLRERREDIRPLATYLLARRSVAAGRRPMRWTPNAMRIIENHPWPGNVRELVNAVDYVVALSEGEQVGDRDLPEDIRQERARPRPTARGRYAAAESMQEERARIVEALRANHYHRQRTADALGMDRVTLYRKMKELSIGSGRG